MSLIHYTIRVVGRVQGVAFRKYTYDKARSLNICGIVQNDTNGDVLIEVEAEEEILKEFVRWCHKGSPFSKVNSVEVVEGSLKSFNTFEILMSGTAEH